MKKEKALILALLNMAVNNNFNITDINCDFEKIISIAEGHNILNIIAPFIIKLDINDEYKNYFKHQNMLGIVKSIQKNAITQNILDEFEKSKIPCMPLKGYITQNYYPQKEYRQMVDIDLLIKEQDVSKISDILKKYDFEFLKETSHEYVFVKKNLFSIELHKTLVPNNNSNLYSYYKNSWSFAKKADGKDYIYNMAFEDFYVYNVAHTAKHCLSSALGIIRLIDIYMLTNSNDYKNCNKEYILNTLKKLGLDTFNEAVNNLLDVWFNNKEHTLQTAQLEEFVFNSSLFGKKEDKKIAKFRAKNGKNLLAYRIKSVINMIFYDFKTLSYRYPILKKCPVLFPFVTVYRWFDVAFKRNNEISSKLKSTNIDVKKAQDFDEFCKNLGISKTL